MQLFLTGFVYSLGLIVAIGAQNVFVVQHGVSQKRPYLVALTCALCDMALITLGVMTAGMIAFDTWVKKGMLFLGAAFLLFYSVRLIRSFPQVRFEKTPEAVKGLSVVLPTMLVSLLNPHALLDTFVLIGGASQNYVGDQRFIFVLGTLAASFVWFFSLSFGASSFRQGIQNPVVWKRFNGLSAAIMIAFSIKLFADGLSI